MIFLGDISLNGTFLNDSLHNAERFQKIEEIFASEKLVFANLEMPVQCLNERNEFKNLIHYSSKETTRDVLKQLNISCVSLANNHIFDCKMPGLKATIELLDSIGIQHTGAGWEPQHIRPVILNNKGRKIGFLAYVDKSTNPKTENFSELLINYLEISAIKKDILSLKNNVDFIICSLHWGRDYSNFYTKEQQRIAYEIIDCGADLIMGHHSHTLQPIEVYKGKNIFYSLGQLCFGDFLWHGELRSLKKKTKTGIIVKLDNCNEVSEIIATKEKKYNYIELAEIDITHKLKKLHRINQLMIKHTFFKQLVVLKETFLDRLYEYFFGYYRNPIKQLVSFQNAFKFKYLIRDYFNNKADN